MNENAMRIATFLFCLIAAVMCVVSAVANWKQYYARAELFAQTEELRQRIERLEIGKELDMRRYTPPPLQQQKPKIVE